MPPFPGMGYPLVPGYEACGEMVKAAPETGFKVGDYVFVHLGQNVLPQMNAVGIPVLSEIPQDDDFRRKSANYPIVGSYESQWGPMFAGLADAVGVAPPVRPSPLTQDALLNLFDAKTTGKDFVLTPATDEDMRGKFAVLKKSLEVVYDNV